MPILSINYLKLGTGLNIQLKIAENVCDNVVAPAINELRYAGRKLIEAWALLQESKHIEASERLRDAMFDCCRAEHDAIDTATAMMATRLVNATDSMGYDVVLKAFTDFPNLRKRITATQRLAEISRKERNNRQATYDTIQASHFPETADAYREFVDSEEIMRGMAITERRKMAVNYLLTAIALIIAVAAWLWPRSP